MSPFHFIRRFESVFGTTPHQFRIQSRLERAKHLLALSDIPSPMSVWKSDLAVSAASARCLHGALERRLPRISAKYAL